MSWVDTGSGLDDLVLYISERWDKVGMFYSSNIGVYGLGVFLDLVSNLVEHFEGGFATDGSDVSSLEKVVLVVNVARHG